MHADEKRGLKPQMHTDEHRWGKSGKDISRSADRASLRFFSSLSFLSSSVCICVHLWFHTNRRSSAFIGGSIFSAHSHPKRTALNLRTCSVRARSVGRRSMLEA